MHWTHVLLHVLYTRQYKHDAAQKAQIAEHVTAGMVLCICLDCDLGCTWVHYRWQLWSPAMLATDHGDSRMQTSTTSAQAACPRSVSCLLCSYVTGPQSRVPVQVQGHRFASWVHDYGLRATLQAYMCTTGQSCAATCAQQVRNMSDATGPQHVRRSRSATCAQQVSPVPFKLHNYIELRLCYTPKFLGVLPPPQHV